jgi:hypothetical protein
VDDVDSATVTIAVPEGGSNVHMDGGEAKFMAKRQFMAE